jgi:hypothetical protein
VTLVAIFDQAADQIRDAVSNDVWDFQVEPWAITSPTPPAIDMYCGGKADVQDASNFGSIVEEMAEGFVLVIRARVSTNDFEGNQDVLYALSDPSDEHCLVQALYDDATLNGLVQDLHLISDSGLTLVSSLDGAVHYGNVWRFLVIPAWS